MFGNKALLLQYRCFGIKLIVWVFGLNFEPSLKMCQKVSQKSSNSNKAPVLFKGVGPTIFSNHMEFRLSSVCTPIFLDLILGTFKDLEF